MNIVRHWKRGLIALGGLCLLLVILDEVWEPLGEPSGMTYEGSLRES
jgi:hypothetical protein